MEMRFILEKRLIAILSLAAVVLISSACGIELSVSSDVGGLTEQIGADDNQAVTGSTIIGLNGLSHSISGQGNLRDRHVASNSAGAYAEVGADVRRAESYSYSYALSPGNGYRWPASKYPSVQASETLNVLNAQYIQAYATAFNAKGYAATVDTEIYDRGREASLIGYSNQASASADEVSASQTAEGASASDGYIEIDSRSKSLDRHPSAGHRTNSVEASTRIDDGNITVYHDLATAKAAEAAVSQKIESAFGKTIQTESGSRRWTASLFHGLKKTADADVSTKIVGSLQGYDASALNSAELTETRQTGHVVGTFTSTATADKMTKTKTSNYGTEYDFDMQARTDASGSSVSGTLGYYVDNSSPVANPIQGAVDAAESGDSINLRAGTYRGNVDIQKSLDIKGAGSADTIVDGQQAGSVFIIGSQDGQQAGSAFAIVSQSSSPVIVGLAGMTIQNGTGTSIVVTPGLPDFNPELGGGVLNFDTLTISNSIISGNTAASGGGIFNYRGTVNLEESTITGNKAIAGAGIASYYGIVNMESGSIDHNEASMVRDITPYLDDLGQVSGVGEIDVFLGELNQSGVSVDRSSSTVGGGIASYRSEVNLNGGSISNNHATIGGGIASYDGALNINNGSIDHNSATIGGGIASILDQLNLNGGSIDQNSADTGIGGGIASYKGVANLIGGSIGNNNAAAGAGVATYHGLVSLDGSSIAGNTATQVGGGILNFKGTVSLLSGSVDHNIAALNGGGIYNLGNVTGNPSIVHDNIPNQIKP